MCTLVLLYYQLFTGGLFLILMLSWCGGGRDGDLAGGKGRNGEGGGDREERGDDGGGGGAGRGRGGAGGGGGDDGGGGAMSRLLVKIAANTEGCFTYMIHYIFPTVL